MKRRKILIVAGRLNVGGLENQLVHLASNYDRSSYQLDFVSDRDNCDYKTTIIESGCGYIVLPSNNDIGLIPYCCRLYRLLKDNQYDVVHSHELFHSGFVMFIAWLAGVPKRISHSHSTKDTRRNNSVIQRLYRRIMRVVLRVFSTDLLACSTEAGKFLYGQKVVSDHRFRVIYNSVATRSFFSEASKAFVYKENWKYVAHVGRFVELKNHRLLIRIADELRNRNKKICFVFVGDGELYESMKELVVQNGLTDYVLFLGLRNDVADILRQCDAFILPSQYEGMPLSLIEAQAAGLPSLVADHITTEVDFGLSLIHRLSLDESIIKWADAVESIVLKKHADRQEIRDAIDRFGFDVTDFVKRVFDVYDK